MSSAHLPDGSQAAADGAEATAATTADDGSQTTLRAHNDDQIRQSADYTKVTEGRATCYFHRTKNEVFYNPIQEFNRDLSIACINTYAATMLADDHKRKSGGVRILEALAASGIRSMRYALEIPSCGGIVANDLDAKAVELIDVNTRLNGVQHLVTSSCDDATALMAACARINGTKHEQPAAPHQRRFDCIDLDPYGSPAVFLDGAVRAIANGGLLLCTATDAGVLCGNGADACFTKYGSPSLRTPCCHELALRILLGSINSHAVRYGRYAQPVLSLSIDFYFRVFVRIGDGQMRAKESIANVGFVHVCADCHSFYARPYGQSVPTKGNVRFVPTTSSSFDLNKCSNCSGCMKIVGPVWLGPLHDQSFVNNVIEHIRSRPITDYATRDRLIGMLHLAAEELPDAPLYHVIDDICSVMHCESPNHRVFRSAILNAGYQVSYSHANKNSLKTNAPNQLIWDILRQWVQHQKPIKAKWLTAEHRVSAILDKPCQHTIDFTIKEECVPASKNEKLLRFHQPPPFWGPKSKPKRKSSVDESDADADKKNKKDNNLESDQAQSSTTTPST